MDADKMVWALINTTLALRKTEISQYELAAKAKVNPTLLSKYLRGARPMPADVSKKLVKALGIDKMMAEMTAEKQVEKLEKVAIEKEVNRSKSSAGVR